MALTIKERSPNLLDIIKDAINTELLDFWTNLPCEVVKYDSDAVTVNVQPLIKVPIKLKNGEITTVELPELQDVPVMFTCAGGFTITHPINVGDECLVSFSDRCIDLWWQSGGIQNPFDTRQHDLSDGFAFFKPQSQKNKISGISTDSLEIRNDANTCKIQITPDGVINFIGTKSVFHHPVEMKSTLVADGKATMQSGASIGGIEFGEHTHTEQGDGNDVSPPK